MATRDPRQRSEQRGKPTIAGRIRAKLIIGYLISQKLTRDGKRVLECLQKSLRIAASCIDELTTVQLYVDALEHYIYYFERGVPEVNAKHVNSLVDLINTQIDKVHELEYPPAVMAGAASGLIEGVGTPDAVVNHYVLLLKYIVSRMPHALPEAG